MKKKRKRALAQASYYSFAFDLIEVLLYVLNLYANEFHIALLYTLYLHFYCITTYKAHKVLINVVE